MTTTTRPAPAGPVLSAERSARRRRTCTLVVLGLLVLAIVTVISWIGLQAARGPGARDLPHRSVPDGAFGVSTARGAASVRWIGPATDGGYRCLRDTGGASGQCNAEMGIGPWLIPATDGGYQCLRDTGGASGQCNAAEGLPPFTPGSGGANRPADRRHRSGAWRTPNECILANGGDYNACNVGNSGRGDLPYRAIRAG